MWVRRMRAKYSPTKPRWRRRNASASAVTTPSVALSSFARRSGPMRRYQESGRDARTRSGGSRCAMQQHMSRCVRFVALRCAARTARQGARSLTPMGAARSLACAGAAGGHASFGLVVYHAASLGCSRKARSSKRSDAPAPPSCGRSQSVEVTRTARCATDSKRTSATPASVAVRYAPNGCCGECPPHPSPKCASIQPRAGHAVSFVFVVANDAVRCASQIASYARRASSGAQRRGPAPEEDPEHSCISIGCAALSAAGSLRHCIWTVESRRAANPMADSWFRPTSISSISWGGAVSRACLVRG
mmetsp:Transcript_18649/g.74473  ORF Transcript_18649/g.74473 Transcript_18649/m.74473 type:complete len:304 (-) Transcript_18649:206-1117(-)